MFSDNNWLAGFTDGEGCFTRSHSGSGRIYPRFAIGLRHDDVPILEDLREEFDGALNFVKRTRGPTRSDGSPGRRQNAYLWQVTGYNDCQRLVDYFEAFPLRTKKALQYEEWLAAFPALLRV